MRKRIYIAGPISKGDLYHNIKQANDACIRLLREGFAPLCPHWSAYAGGPKYVVAGNYGTDESCWPEFVVGAVAEVLPHGTCHSDWMGMDLPWVEVSHAVLRLPGESTGGDMEVDHAIAHNIPVFYDIDELIRTMNRRDYVSEDSVS